MGLKDILPQEMTGEKCRVVIVGREEMLVEKHRGLISYETDAIRFRVKNGQVHIGGENLVITAFGAEDARVQGKIETLQLTEADV